MIDDDFTTVDFDYSNSIIIENSRGSMDFEYKSHIKDCIGLGAGHTKEEAALSLVACLKQQIEIIEAAIKKKFNNANSGSNS